VKPHQAKLSAGVVVLRQTPAEWLFLLLRAYRNWDFPKGVVEAGEDPLAAAQREVREETSIAELHFTWGAVYDETAPYAGGKVARYYLAETVAESVILPINPELGRPEHHEARWVNIAQALSLTGSRLRPIVLWAAATVGIPRNE
jgi:bis(5'-nucleosidyl)-tetraphosphatase